MDCIRKTSDTRKRKQELSKRRRRFSEPRDFKPCYESYRMNKEMGYYHPNFQENVILESKYITSKRLQTCVELGDIKGVVRILDDGFVPINRCDCCSDNDIQIAIYKDHFDIFNVLLAVTKSNMLTKAIINTITTPDNGKYMSSFFKKVGKFDRNILKYTSFRGLTLIDLLDYEKDLLFLQVNGANLSHLLKRGSGDPEVLRYLICMGASIDSKIHSDPHEKNLSFRQIIKTGPPKPPALEFVYRSYYGLNMDPESYREYNSILNLDFWKYMTRFIKFKDRFETSDDYNFKTKIELISSLDKDVLSHIHSYF